MSVVQSKYDPPQPTNPSAVKLAISFISTPTVCTIDPVETNMVNYPEHSILVGIRTSGNISSVPVVADSPPDNPDGYTFLALRPEDANELGRKLIEIAGCYSDHDKEAR